MFSTLRTQPFQHRARRGILILAALCLLLLVAARIQPTSADDTPTLQFSTYLGGSGREYGENIALDDDGNIYVTGDTDSADFPATNGLGVAGPGIYVTKFDPTGMTQLYSVFLGSGNVYGLTVDADGSAYVVGAGTNIPTTVNAIQSTLHGTEDAFITKINPSGTGLVYSTYLGGDSDDFALGVGLDADRNAYIVGATMSTNFPTQNPYQAAYGGGQWDVFVARLNTAGSALVYSTYYGGNDRDISMDIAVDSAGNAYFTGDTASTNFPTVNPYQAALRTPCVYGPSTPCRDAYVVKFNSSGTPLYSTYLGGTGNNDRGYGIAVDSLGAIYITGDTTSSNFPVSVNAFQTAAGTSGAAFVTKFSPDGSQLIYSTYLNGTTNNAGTQGSDIVVNPDGQAFVTGYTSTANFPSVNPIQPHLNGPGDIYISQLNTDGSALLLSTYLGGSDEESNEFSPRLALDSVGSVYITSTTFSDDFPTLHAFQSDPAGPFSPLDQFGIPGPPNFDSFVVKIGFLYVPHAEPAQAAVRNYFFTDTPTLAWTPVTWATHYHVQVSKDKLFKGTLAFDDVTGASQFSIMTDHLDDGLYYWHVQAQEADGDWGNYSPTESFTIYAN